ncbi:MAG: hypothetical protein SAL07_17175 [Oscillatoria sp. PMC 1051.18]|nr:hypothetical protein [Oscillatoria sp. PMC 1050.18]MEC5031634.1 hypothetical protein [Oscillatoria sp. PMC 1051.18]
MEIRTTVKDFFSELLQRQQTLWFSMSIVVALGYSLLAWQQAFSSEYVVQDDARQHVFWMLRFVDGELFPDDLIADYFQSVAPLGYTNLYKLAAALGIDPLLFNKLLPLGLAAIATGFLFALCLEIFPVPAAGFLSALIFNLSLWTKEDLVSATPRAFIYPFLLAFCYYLLKRKFVPTLAAIALQGLFYPQGIFIIAGVLLLRLFRWRSGKIRLSGSRQDYWFCLTGLGVALIVLLPFALTTSEYGPVISAADAKILPEFLPGGRAEFFLKNPWEFWLLATRSGIFASKLLLLLTIVDVVIIGLLLHYRSQLPMLRQINNKIVLLPQLLLASLGIFCLAHLTLYKLHLPSRYTQHSLRIILALVMGIALTIFYDALVAHFSEHKLGKLRAETIIAFSSLILVAGVAIFPAIANDDFPKTIYRIGNAPTLYEFFAQTPKDSLIASLSLETNNIPTFSQRSVLTNREAGVPYHTGYYRQYRQRTIELIAASYSHDLKDIKNLISKYGIDFYFLEDNFTTPQYLSEQNWLEQFPLVDTIEAKLAQGIMPALTTLSPTCTVFQGEGYTILSAECILAN